MKFFCSFLDLVLRFQYFFKLSMYSTYSFDCALLYARDWEIVQIMVQMEKKRNKGLKYPDAALGPTARQEFFSGESSS